MPTSTKQAKALKIAKQLAEELKPKPLTPEQRRKWIDEGGPLVKRVKKLTARLKEIKDQIAEWADGLPAAKDTTYQGNRFMAEVSACEFEREITDMPGVQKAIDEKLGAATFVKHADMALKTLDVLLPNALKLGLVSKERTGSREVKIVPKPPAERKAA